MILMFFKNIKNKHRLTNGKLLNSFNFPKIIEYLNNLKVGKNI